MNRIERALKELSPDEERRAKRKMRIALAQDDFWLFCKSIAPDFYKESRPHLKKICYTLQALYENRIWKPSVVVYDKFNKPMLRPRPNSEWTIAETKTDVPADAFICDNLKMHIPPRHGKSRTLIYYECWCFGQDLHNSVITVSYNSLVAEEFSRYVRDEICKTRNDDKTIVFSDIFPNVRLKEDDASVTKWSLQGSHFSYLGTGMNGTTTSKGGTIQVVDDPIKDSNVALNEVELQSQWDWFNNTFLSRTDAVGGHSKLIVNHTRWSTKDIAGRIDSDLEQRDMWYTLLMKVMDEETGDMLCEDILDRSTFYKITGNMDTSIMRANYFQEPLDIQGRLYDTFMEYSELPDNVVAIRSECDPADTGKDYLCNIIYAETKDHFAYVLDVIYNNQKVEITIPLVADALIQYKVNKLVGESNAGGRLLFENLKKYLEEQRHWYRTIIDAKPTTNQQNKATRINTMAYVVKNRIFMPRNWEKRFDTFAKDVYSYISGGKNAHDDGPDCLTRIAERITEGGGYGVLDKKEFMGNNSNYKVQPVVRVARMIRR